MTLLVGWQEVHPAHTKSWVLVCWWWRFDWILVYLTAPVVTTNFVIPCPSKIQNGDILVSAAYRGLSPENGHLNECRAFCVCLMTESRLMKAMAARQWTFFCRTILKFYSASPALVVSSKFIFSLFACMRSLAFWQADLVIFLWSLWVWLSWRFWQAGCV